MLERWPCISRARILRLAAAGQIVSRKLKAELDPSRGILNISQGSSREQIHNGRFPEHHVHRVHVSCRVTMAECPSSSRVRRSHRLYGAPWRNYGTTELRRNSKRCLPHWSSSRASPSLLDGRRVTCSTSRYHKGDMLLLFRSLYRGLCA